jgi:hypothetical protein
MFGVITYAVNNKLVLGISAREREQRERLRDLAVFERVNGNISKTSAELAVKKVKHDTNLGYEKQGKIVLYVC